MMTHQIPERIKIQKKSDNTADTGGEFLTLDGVAKYMHLSRMSVHNLLTHDSSFPKGFPILSGEKKSRKLWKKQDVADWIVSQTEKSES